MKRFLITILFAAILVPFGYGQTQVPIVNPSFEINPPAGTTASNNWNYGPVSGWSCNGTGGLFNPTPAQVHSGTTGTTTLWLNSGAGCTQDVGSAAAATNYSLTVSVGSQIGFAGAYTISYGGCSINGVTNQGVLTPVTLPCSAPTGEIVISLATTNGQVIFDNISLTATSTIPPAPNVTLTINPNSTAVYDNANPILTGTVIVSQEQNATTATQIGTIMSDSSGNLSGTLVVNPNWMDANNNLNFVFGLAAVPYTIVYPVPVAEFQHGSTGLTLNLTLFSAGSLAIKNQTIGVTP